MFLELAIVTILPVLCFFVGVLPLLDGASLLCQCFNTDKQRDVNAILVHSCIDVSSYFRHGAATTGRLG